MLKIKEIIFGSLRTNLLKFKFTKFLKAFNLIFYSAINKIIKI
jgi:hypothetical protein